MLRFVFCIWALGLAGSAAAQDTSVGFGTAPPDPDAPVEVAADQLTLSQDDGTAVFTGNVIVDQGEIRMTAAEVRIFYDEESGDVSHMEATGGVTLLSGAEAAESQRADYDVDSGVIVMTGDVLLTQGRNALASERMEVNLATNTALMTGRVQTVLFQGGNDDAPEQP